jgi:hypothetical protein
MRLLRRRLVRIHQLDPGPTIEGLLVGSPWRQTGLFKVQMAKILAGPDQSVVLDSKEEWIPREKVVWVEILR